MNLENGCHMVKQMYQTLPVKNGSYTFCLVSGQTTSGVDENEEVVELCFASLKTLEIPGW